MKRNLIIAAVAIAAIAGGARYKAHVDFWSFYEACNSARESRIEASALLGQAKERGHFPSVGKATAILQNANDLIARCNARGA